MVEADKFVGRIEVKADRSAGILRVENVWPEREISFGSGRTSRLHAELERMARFVGMDDIQYARHYLKD